MVEVPLPPRRCAARRMTTFPAAPLLLALEALAATSKGLPAPARFASALLPRAQVGCRGCVATACGSHPSTPPSPGPLPPLYAIRPFFQSGPLTTSPAACGASCA